MDASSDMDISDGDQWLPTQSTLPASRPWTTEEDKLLHTAKRAHSSWSWKALSNKFFQGQRTADELQARWWSKNTKTSQLWEWTKKEEEQLRAGVEAYKNDWQKISQDFLNGGRTDEAVARRARTLGIWAGDDSLLSYASSSASSDSETEETDSEYLEDVQVKITPPKTGKGKGRAVGPSTLVSPGTSEAALSPSSPPTSPSTHPATLIANGESPFSVKMLPESIGLSPVSELFEGLERLRQEQQEYHRQQASETMAALSKTYLVPGATMDELQQFSLLTQKEMGKLKDEGRQAKEEIAARITAGLKQWLNEG